MEIIERIPDPQRRLDEWGIPIEKFNWSAYNNSQMREKIMFLELLSDLCKLIDDDHFLMCGRKPKSLSSQIFCVCLKAYLNTSSRRLISEIELCKRKGFLGGVPHFNSILNYLGSRQMKRVLNYLIELSALPLAQHEDKFAMDSTGFGEHKYAERWSTVRQKHYLHRSYRKAHCIYGTYSNIIASAIITEGIAGDSPKFKSLLSNAAANFDIKEISADKAYLSRENLKHAEKLGITPFIPFKKGSTGKSRGAPIWNKMYKYFQNNKEEFLKHYHLRSNAESGFFMIKQRFGDFVKTKNDLSQDNEILAKILCHNLCVLIQEIFLSNLEIDFLICAEKCHAQKWD